MSRGNRAAIALILTAGLSSLALAQGAKPADSKPATAAAPAAAQPGKGDMKMPSPEEMKKLQDMGKAWEEAGIPGKEHALLARGAGTWEGKIKSYEMPGQPPAESACTETMTSIMGGRFLKCEVKGEMGMEGKMMPFEGLGIYGYENGAGEYTMTWIDNMGTAIFKGTGKASADGKIMTWTMSCTDPFTKKMITMREVDTVVSDTETRMEMFGDNPMAPGKEYKMIQIDFKRTGPAPKMDEMKKSEPKPASSGSTGSAPAKK